VLGLVFFTPNEETAWGNVSETTYSVSSGIYVRGPNFELEVDWKSILPTKLVAAATSLEGSKKTNFRSFICSHSSTIRANRASLKIGQNRQREEGKTSIFVSSPSAAKLVAALSRVAGVTAGLMESNGSRIYDSRHLQADCREPGSAPEPYAR